MPRFPYPRRAPALARVLLLLSAAPAAHAAPVASADYFPLAPGTTWTYSGDGTRTRQVQPPSPPGSTLRVLRTISGTGTGEAETYELAASGILEYSLVGAGTGSPVVTFSPPIVLLPPSVDAGNSGAQNGDVSIGSLGTPGTYSYAWQVMSIGAQGSQCDVLVVSETLSISSLGDTTTRHSLVRLARGVGVVQNSGDLDGLPFDLQLTSSSLPLALDTDCDGIPDDGNLSGTAGDLPCAAPLVQLCDDNCRNTANPGQADTGGLNSSSANGIGNACECGDASDDGRVNLVDAARLARHLASLPPALAAPQKCQVLAAGPCDASQLLRLRQVLAGSPGGIAEVCPAYTGVPIP